MTEEKKDYTIPVVVGGLALIALWSTIRDESTGFDGMFDFLFPKPTPKVELPPDCKYVIEGRDTDKCAKTFVEAKRSAKTESKRSAAGQIEVFAGSGHDTNTMNTVKYACREGICVSTRSRSWEAKLRQRVQKNKRKHGRFAEGR